MPVSKLVSTASSRQQYIALGHTLTPFISVYPWSTVSGFGTKLSNPTTLPTNKIVGISFSPSGYQVAAVIDAGAGSSNVVAYQWSNAGFGAQLSSPSSLPPGIPTAVAFSPAGDAIAITSNSSPHITAYAWSSSGFGGKYSDPASVFSSAAVYCLDFTPAGDALVIGAYGSLHAYAWSSAGFGSKYSDSGVVDAVYGLKCNSLGTIVFLGTGTSPYVVAKEFNSSTGFGGYYNPNTGPAGSVTGVSVATLGGTEYVAVSCSSSPYHAFYAWTNNAGNGWGSRVTTSALAMTGIAYCVSYSKTKETVAFGYNASPYVSTISFPGANPGTRYNNPATLPNGTVLSLCYGVIG